MPRHRKPATYLAENQPPIREFETGATRDGDAGKLDFEGFLSPVVLEAFAAYMDAHRTLPDGCLRSSDNWQAGIPLDAYMKSLLRHVMALWLTHRGHLGREHIGLALCGILFNTQGYFHEVLSTDPALMDDALQELHASRPQPVSEGSKP